MGIAKEMARRGYPAPTPADISHVLKLAFEVIGDELEKGERVAIENFGAFYIKAVPERLYYNFRKGITEMVPPNVHIHFKPTWKFKKKLKAQMKEKLEAYRRS